MNLDLTKGQWWVLWITVILLSFGSYCAGQDYYNPYLQILLPILLIGGTLFFSINNRVGRKVAIIAISCSVLIIVTLWVVDKISQANMIKERQRKEAEYRQSHPGEYRFQRERRPSKVEDD